MAYTKVKARLQIWHTRQGVQVKVLEMFKVSTLGSAADPHRTLRHGWSISLQPLCLAGVHNLMASLH